MSVTGTSETDIKYQPLSVHKKLDAARRAPYKEEKNLWITWHFSLNLKYEACYSVCVCVCVRAPPPFFFTFIKYQNDQINMRLSEHVAFMRNIKHIQICGQKTWRDQT